MPSSISLLQAICGLLLLLDLVSGLKFDIEAHHQGDAKGKRCIRNIVAKDTLVVVTTVVSGTKGDGQRLDMHVRLPLSLRDPVYGTRLCDGELYLTVVRLDQRCHGK